MELYSMLYQRLIGSTALAALLATYNGRAAVFYQRAAPSDDLKWGDCQYPRIDYNVDMQENPARNTSGVLTINIWCDTQHGAEPEDIDYRLRDLLHAVFAQADDYPYCFSWVRSDAFEIRTDKEQTVRTIGVTLIFDIMAYPSQCSMYPDPVKAMNRWTKDVLPTAIVIGADPINGWIVPTRESPVVYWRLASQGIQEKHYAYTWLNISMEGHVYARNAGDRLYNLTRLNTAAATIAGHIAMEDQSPMFIKNFECKPHLAYLSQGQIQVNGRFGLLQPWYSRASGPKINHLHFRTEDL
ncbi:MAG: hypothetical protein RSC06_03390 [Clostridia bacterium]